MKLVHTNEIGPSSSSSPSPSPSPYHHNHRWCCCWCQRTNRSNNRSKHHGREFNKNPHLEECFGNQSIQTRPLGRSARQIVIPSAKKSQKRPAPTKSSLSASSFHLPWKSSPPCPPCTDSPSPWACPGAAAWYTAANARCSERPPPTKVCSPPTSALPSSPAPPDGKINQHPSPSRMTSRPRRHVENARKDRHPARDQLSFKPSAR